ncbi:Pyrroline-5-carboxylate reductase [Hibiscus syriacus]|uniref:Pyrroline-5-carboxylate reductase n=1 Tax=Hibiscus syriacus TaxID=106335 RepID=A0A6A2X200_HIBSY|nr:Pyrroline-5-carboxylate reductase [Hibiscus syriacus]
MIYAWLWVVDASDVIIFSVKPQVAKNVVLQLRPLLSKKKLLVSIAAGIKLKDLEEWAGHGQFIRVMPNIPSAAGMAASVMSLGGSATEQDGELVGKLFGSVGKIWKADEKLFQSLPRELALGLASETVLGAASMAVQSGKHPGLLKDDVTSPGGTTIVGIHELEKNGFRGTFMNAVVAAAKRSQELS